MKTFDRGSLLSFVLAGCVFFGAGCQTPSLVDDGGGRKPEDFPELALDVFQQMDGGMRLTEEEIKGRNTWNLWCAGTEQFWERMSRESYGLIDLLKTIDSRKRGSRFAKMGLINQPGFKQASRPDKHGLWIDEAEVPEPAGIDPKVYGHPTGLMGFRYFENPEFKGAAAAKWDANRYYTDADYAVRKDLVRPYRVGISCGSCHIAFNPVNPPQDPENPKWENLASVIGNQYIREGATFAALVQEGGFFAEMLKNQPPGTSDTSRIGTDHINNPNSINPIFELGARLSQTSPERLSSETLLMPDTAPVSKVPHVLKDGADSIGMVGATLRVYVNIGMYSQHWLKQHNALIGLKDQKPFSIKTAQENSVYWNATQQKFTNVANFFMRLKSFRLEDAPGGSNFLTTNMTVLNRGKIVFAENCAECHSSKRPPANQNAKEWFRAEVMKADFRDNNFFSDDERHPVTKIKSNASRAVASNAKRGHIWHNFSSDTYKELDQVSDIQVWDPYAERTNTFTIPPGGSGYYRTPSLISIWSSAPFLHNNALGKFTNDPSVEARMAAFNDAAEKLLWPEKRLDKGSIWRTTRECNLQIQGSVLPTPFRQLLKRHLDPDGYFRLGPIPEGTPINLLANIDPNANKRDLVKLILKLKFAFAEIKARKLDSAAAKELLRREVAPALMKVNTCPDFVEDRGHYFGTDTLNDADKRALIEYLKTL